MTYTIVTAFLDIGRSDWKTIHARKTSLYLRNARRMLTLNNFMVIYIEKKLYDFVYECRKDQLNITKIIVVSLNDLPAIKYYDSFCKIMNSHEYKMGLKDDNVPECSEPLYDIVMFSKTHFLKSSIENDYFQTSHYVWLDFGVHASMLPDKYLNKKLFQDTEIRSKLSFLCLNIPTQNDLNIKIFYKSHNVKFAGTCFTGDKQHLLQLHDYMNNEIQECIKHNVIDSDQALFNVIYLKHPELFRLWFGNWDQLITNYVTTKENLNHVYSMLNDCLMQNNNSLYTEILNTM